EKFTVFPNGSGSRRIGVLSDSGAVRSTTSTVPAATAAANSASSDKATTSHGVARGHPRRVLRRRYRRAAGAARPRLRRSETGTLLLRVLGLHGIRQSLVGVPEML